MIYLFKVIYYCYLMYLRTSFDVFDYCTRITNASRLNKTSKLGLLTDIDKLLMTEKGRWNMLHYSLIYQN